VPASSDFEEITFQIDAGSRQLQKAIADGERRRIYFARLWVKLPVSRRGLSYHPWLSQWNQLSCCCEKVDVVNFGTGTERIARIILPVRRCGDAEQ
jgi:hypothetical protein